MSAVDEAPSPARALGGQRIVPVYTPRGADEALAVAQALWRGGIGAIEVTLRTPQALEAIAAIAQALPRMAVGAGTVLDAGQMRAARHAGARFAVSPGSLPELLALARELDLPYLPGVATSSELMAGLAAGYRCFKLFPAEPLGALGLLAAWQAPFPQARFCPTGGIGLARAREYLRRPNVLCLGGSWLTPDAALRAGDWAQVEALAREAAALAGA
ncbi:bifunctional 4-hydroxy-2-oxoglutarate aldolase/2-dehydro-3-deoxy-phosphogluconate aldolase [Vulcaniibacterium tengchongense]|uniref:2-dehydro-3-deoxy-phosphogluconate aldolase n=1 Tax=Vulcaniibacterium tengchongense TaxID=1273429 RepID=A0A3N4VFF8_9GAMM|nr:bifunctional 4-hydroxy-2-oxoglutarate aldolase/2-dehydro-3-deoxy-phosphogluconate aldolase [Vulcaniibacterium tengchongense]RPE75917.1 2-dehydro-3-deoxyphosphogluconate aldolase/(4S)-4-hydroxy-2-oxoglutarate aldolase [Vulcaniibacterium tengchongense]